MLSRVNSMEWIEEVEKEASSSSCANNNAIMGLLQEQEEMVVGNGSCSLSTFKSMLEAEGDQWYINNHSTTTTMNDHAISFAPPNNHHHLLLQLPVDSSASCSPTPTSSVFNNLEYPSHPHLNNYLSLIPNNNNPLDLGCESGYLESLLSGGGCFGDVGAHHAQFGSANNLGQGSVGFGAFGFGEEESILENSLLLFNSRSNKILKPLDDFASVGAQPTLFQKRAALRKSLDHGRSLGCLNQTSAVNVESYDMKGEISEVNERKRKFSSVDHIEDVNVEESSLNYVVSNDQFFEHCGVSKVEDSAVNGQGSSHEHSTVTGGDQKGKKKGLPAKNLMAERRRRKKLNDRLYMLRSVVPKISKMDRASILGDAVEYLKELLQKINDLRNELEPGSGSSSSTPTTAFNPLTPTTPGLFTRVKEELCPTTFSSALSSPTGKPASVEVRLREGRGVNIHMFCRSRPGLLLSTMRAMDSFGLDVQQAVISCFNGFALDIFRAEQRMEGQDLNPDQIKAILLESAGFNVMM